MRLPSFIRVDSPWPGLVLGLLSPFLGFYLYYLMEFSNILSFKKFLDFVDTPNLMAKVISLAVLINLPLFFLFIQLRHDKNARSVLGATILYGALIAWLKFLA
jgi:hypothetical protein